MSVTTDKIPTTIITGFLGAGKTSLVQHLLRNAGHRQFAVIVNEFGELGVDGALMRGCGDESCADDDIVELTNGCLCCTVADDFIPTMQKLIEREQPPKHILIETSGVALPKPLIKAFGWPTIREHVTVDGVIAVVDGPAVLDGRFADDPEKIAAQRAEDPNLDHDNPLSELYEDQINAADLIVINKIDLLTEDDRATVSAQIKATLSPAVKLVECYEGQVDPNVILGLDASAELDLDGRPSHHDHVDGEHDHDDFETVVIPINEVDSADRLISRLQQISGDHPILRIKGFVPIKGRPMRLLIQGVGARYRHHFDQPWSDMEPRQGKLVIIGRAGLDHVAINDAIAR